MLRPDFAAAHVAAELAHERARIALPSPVGVNAPHQFRALFNEIQRDVASFISEGSGTRARPLANIPSLSAEGRAHRTTTQEQTTKVDRARQKEFIASIAPWARQTAARLGVEPELVAAHAALESGWGQRPLRTDDGAPTHNLFGIKAGRSWRGDVVRALTTEIEEGVASKRKETFRSYADIGQAFGDYANLLLTRARYAGAVNVGGDATAFAAALAQGRYATDPLYAQKLERVVQQVREIGLPSVSEAGVR
ncbi:MAG: glucosaminidase domain-containing protein [Gammaproteobacteria bacterium]|nr:flagellar assembly peptidoglycan hydrolase FlgJ [Gammaproteobacteria bacterium]